VDTRYLKVSKDERVYNSQTMKWKIRYGFSVRDDGDMRKHDVVRRYLVQQGLDSNNLITAQQIHGTNIQNVIGLDRGKQISHVDGLLYEPDDTVSSSVILGVLTADCVPVLLHDPVKGIIAVVHSGWKGTIGGIVPRVIEMFVRRGVDTKTIRCVIGPHIRSCCYWVDSDRAATFITRFGQAVVQQKNKQPYCDLTFAIKKQLEEAGIKDSHIIEEKLCTACNEQQYYSYRKDTKETFGEMLGFIAISR
jgi:polyphenol oxidase